MGGVEAAKAGSADRLCATDATKAYKRGLTLFGEGSYDKALIFFDEAIGFRVDCSHYFAARGNCKQAMGEHMDAYHDYVSAIRLNRTKCAYFSCRGLCLLKIGKLEAALSDFSKACELEPSAAVYHYQKASLLHHHLARPGEAIVSYGECLANTRSGDIATTVKCLYAKGSCLLKEGRAAEAVEDLSRAVEISNPSPSSLHCFAKALKEVGREEEALEVLGEAIDKWSSAPSVQDGRPSDKGHELFLDRGVLRLKRGDDAGAVSDLDEAVTLSGGARGGYFVQRARARARVAMRSHGREEAEAGLQDIEKAMELEPGNTEFLFTAGVLCSRMGEYNQALDHLQRLMGVYQERAASARSRTCTGGGGGGAERTAEQARDATSPASPRESDAPGVKDSATSPAACEFEMALCLYKLGRPLEALRLAEPRLASWCLQDARRFQLRGLIKHDLKRFGEAVKDFTASIAINGQKPEGFLLRGRSLAGQSRHERAVDDFTTALGLLKPNTDPRVSPHEETAAEQNQKHFSDPSRGNPPRAHGGVDDGGYHRSITLAAVTSEGMAGSNAIHDESSTISHSQNQEYGYGSTSGVIAGSTAGVEDGHHRARCEPTAGGANAPDRVSRDDGEDGMVEWGSVAGACHYARALSLQQLGRYADAANDFDEAVGEGPVSWQRLWHRAICLAELGETFRESAARDLRACLSMAKEEQIPEMPHFLFQVGLAYLRLGDSTTALTNFYRSRESELSLRHSPSHSNVTHEGEEDGGQPLPGVRQEQFEASLHYHIGVCLAKTGNLPEAEHEFSSACACPNGQATSGVHAGSSCSDEGLRAAFHRERGKVRQLLRNFKGARSDFTTCLGRPRSSSVDAANEISQHDARTLFRRGWANKALGKLVEAAADFEAARLMEPSHPSLSVDYRNIFEIELVVVDDIEPVTQSPALFHNW